MRQFVWVLSNSNNCRGSSIRAITEVYQTNFTTYESHSHRHSMLELVIFLYATCFLPYNIFSEIKYFAVYRRLSKSFTFILVLITSFTVKYFALYCGHFTWFVLHWAMHSILIAYIIVCNIAFLRKLFGKNVSTASFMPFLTKSNGQTIPF